MGNQSRFRVAALTESRFGDMADEWEQLLSRSSADRLFMSWPWQFTWWECWAGDLGLELVLLAVYDQDNVLMGLAPLFRYQHLTPRGITIDRLQLIGNAWHIKPTVRTEYCGLILDRDKAVAVRKCLLGALAQLGWDELVLCDVSEHEASDWKNGSFNKPPATWVHRSKDTGVTIDTRGDFQQWLMSLGRNTRLKLYNRRKYLFENGNLVRACVSRDDSGQFFAKLNEFHQIRWGKPCFDEKALAFHSRLIRRLARSDCEVFLSEMHFNNECVAVQYDIRAGMTLYNIQSGYRESFDSKVALGTLHLGFLIETGFNDPTIACYDLLAGEGKNTFYKGRLNGTEVDFLTIQVARKPMLRFIYRCQALLPDRWRRSINRYFRF